MINHALRDLFYFLQQIKGGHQASALYLTVLEQLKSFDLLVPDDELYDDWDGQCGLRHLAAAGLGSAGRVSVAPSI